MNPRRFSWRSIGLAAALGLLPGGMGQTVFAHGELNIRIAALTRELATNASAKLYLARGELFRADQNWEGAVADYERAAALGYPAEQVDFCRAQLLEDRGELEPCLALLDNLISRNPCKGGPLLARARLKVRMGQSRLALPDFEQAFGLLQEPEPEWFLEWARTLASEGRTPEALRVLDRGMIAAGPATSLQAYAVELELTRKDTDQALARLETIIRAETRKERWLIERGDIQTLAGRLTDARKSYEAALAAIRLLPVHLQKYPPTQKLISRINNALTELARL